MPSWIHQRRNETANNTASTSHSTTSNTPIIQSLTARIQHQPRGNTAPIPAEKAPLNTSNLLYLLLSFGFSLLVNVWTFYRLTGGLFNPVIILALCLCRGIYSIRGVLVFASQILAGIILAGVVRPFIKIFLTAYLVFVVVILAVVNQESTFLAPIGIGLVLFVNQLVGTYYTGCAFNPACALGPNIINRSFPRYQWIYWIEPLLESLLIYRFYSFVSIFHYKTEAAAGPSPWHKVMDQHASKPKSSHLPSNRSTFNSTNAAAAESNC
ncbi:aquaporin-like protein [Aspergillus novoparasiticus]|uniref:Aquaporin-like protein n=1 Tax=Aspergillus novoparasiticus TaxID=986946 RepID=A0A5N6FCZ5_9EURO|nr:aquaporin-like protein [Aspergillus novoparasiticus]